MVLPILFNGLLTYLELNEKWIMCNIKMLDGIHKMKPQLLMGLKYCQNLDSLWILISLKTLYLLAVSDCFLKTTFLKKMMNSDKKDNTIYRSFSKFDF
jgi:hypothetical protein